jgi:hypothetical protein
MSINPGFHAIGQHCECYNNHAAWRSLALEYRNALEGIVDFVSPEVDAENKAHQHAHRVLCYTLPGEEKK